MEIHEKFENDDSWISEESDFYGDENVRSSLERQCKRKIQQSHNPFASTMAKRIKLESQATTSTGKPNQDVLDFLKTRPQIAAFDSAAASTRKDLNVRASKSSNAVEGLELLRKELLDGNSGSWQEHETIDDFLKRCPILDPATASVGPWLWVGNSQVHAKQTRHEKREDISGFIEIGSELLESFRRQKSNIEAQNDGKASSTITRKMGPYRDQLETDLLEAAIKTKTTCGKWMLFPNPTDLTRFWRLVAEGTAQGRLGPVSKVATYEPYDDKDVRLICVYTYNFADIEDVRRVLDELVALGLCAVDTKPIYYKCDAYTYLDLKADNQYKLRASLFSSTEILKNSARMLEEGRFAKLTRLSNDVNKAD